MRKLLIGLSFLSMGFSQQPRAWDDGKPASWGAMVNGWQLALRTETQAVFIDEAAWVSLSVLNGTGTSSHISREKSDWMIAEFQIQRVDGGGLIPLRPVRDKSEKLWRAGMGSSRTAHQSTCRHEWNRIEQHNSL
jgi:hypothetical protein